MSEYLVWNEKKIDYFSDTNIENLYDSGYVFTRKGRGIMDQTRSIRINLEKYEPSSENKRILRKTEQLKLRVANLPYEDYDWTIGKMAKDFYELKFGKGTFSANKAKELITNTETSNFNRLFIYKVDSVHTGYCIGFESMGLMHYSYPFYDLNVQESEIKNLGMSMMLKAVIYAKEAKKKYIYLGSAQRKSDIYKLQFNGLEWFDGIKWSDDPKNLKSILKNLT